jgi:hypothetical protein
LSVFAIAALFTGCPPTLYVAIFNQTRRVVKIDNSTSRVAARLFHIFSWHLASLGGW